LGSKIKNILIIFQGIFINYLHHPAIQGIK